MSLKSNFNYTASSRFESEVCKLMLELFSGVARSRVFCGEDQGSRLLNVLVVVEETRRLVVAERLVDAKVGHQVRLGATLVANGLNVLYLQLHRRSEALDPHFGVI